MGIGHHSLPQEPIVQRYASVTIESPDTLAILDSDGEYGALYKFVKHEWEPGVERVLRRNEFWMFRLRGKPFATPQPNLQIAGCGLPRHGSHEDVQCYTRHFFSQMIDHLAIDGYRLEACPYTGRLYTRNTLVFVKPGVDSEGRKISTVHHQHEPNVSCVGIRGRNILELSSDANRRLTPIGYEDRKLKRHGELVPLAKGRGLPDATVPLLQWVKDEFQSKITEVDEDSVGRSFPPPPIISTLSPPPASKGRHYFDEIAFQGSPFFLERGSKTEEVITAKRLFLGTVRLLHQRHFHYVGTLSMRGGGRNDTFYFQRHEEVGGEESDDGMPDSQFFLLSLDARAMRLFECSPDTVRLIEGHLTEVGRVKATKPSYMGCCEIQLALPASLYSLSSEQLTDWQLDFLTLVDVVRRRGGWKLAGAMQISQSLQDKATLLFESVSAAESAHPPPNLFGISTVRNDQLRLFYPEIGGNATVMHRDDLFDMLREAIVKAWPRGIQSEWNASPQVHVVKLKGRPWFNRDTFIGSTGDTLRGVQLLVYLIERLASEGWRLVVAMDVGGRVNTDDEFHTYNEDGELLVFERSIGSDNGEHVANGNAIGDK